MAYHDHEAAARGDGIALRRSLDRLSDGIEQLGGHVGISPFRQTQQQSTIAKPPVLHATISVVGIDGKFFVTLTAPVQGVNRRGGARGGGGPRKNPYSDDDARISRQLEMTRLNDGRKNQRLLHEVQSALDSNFNANSSVVSYGITEQLSYTIQDPNVTRVWRVHSRFEGSDFNDWTYFTDPATCGVVGVYSGLLRSVAITLVNQSATTSTGTSPLTQHLLTTQIDVASATWKYGSQSPAPVYASGLVDPLGYGKYYVYALDPKRAGGVVTYIATLNVADVTANDGAIYFGVITTSAGGGGTGSGGGSGGGCHVAGTLITMHDGTKRVIESLVKGSVLRGHDGGPEVLQQPFEIVALQPVFRLEFSNGVVARGRSASDVLRRESGGYVSVFDALEGDRFRTELGSAALRKKVFAEMQTVYNLRHLDRTKTLIADGVEGHNKMPV